MKVRIGFGLGTGGMASPDEDFGPFVDDLERLGFDSLWLSERVTGEGPDPLGGLAFAAGRTTRLKLGTSVLVVPGRNPVVLAGALATVDRLSAGRFLPAVGMGTTDPAERQAFGVAPGERGPWLDEALPLVRRLWVEDRVDHDGPRFSYHGPGVRPRPVQSPLDVWLAGQAPSGLRRVGRLGDGWLPSFCTPADAAAGRVVVEEAADRAGRAIDPEHWGAVVFYAEGPVPDRLRQAAARRRPDLAVDELVPSGLPRLRTALERFCEVGFSKFVVMPAVEPPSWTDALGAAAEELLPLQG